MNKKQGIVLAVTVLIVALIVLTGILGKKEKEPREVSGGGVVPTPETTAAPTVKPSTGAEPRTPKNVIVTMTISKDGYAPAEISATQGDTVFIDLTASDGDYDILFPHNKLYQYVERGRTQRISLQAGAQGTLSYTCRDYCPGGKVIKGSLIVLP